MLPTTCGRRLIVTTVGVGLLVSATSGVTAAATDPARVASRDFVGAQGVNSPADSVTDSSVWTGTLTYHEDINQTGPGTNGAVTTLALHAVATVGVTTDGTGEEGSGIFTYSDPTFTATWSDVVNYGDNLPGCVSTETWAADGEQPFVDMNYPGALQIDTETQTYELIFPLVTEDGARTDSQTAACPGGATSSTVTTAPPDYSDPGLGNPPDQTLPSSPTQLTGIYPTSSEDTNSTDTTSVSWDLRRQDNKPPGIMVAKLITDPSGGNGVQFSGPISALLGDGGSHSAQVAPGTYTEHVSPPPGWTVQTITCNPGDPYVPGSNQAMYRVQSGETTICAAVVQGPQEIPQGDSGWQRFCSSDSMQAFMSGGGGSAGWVSKLLELSKAGGVLGGGGRGLGWAGMGMGAAGIGCSLDPPPGSSKVLDGLCAGGATFAFETGAAGTYVPGLPGLGFAGLSFLTGVGSGIACSKDPADMAFTTIARPEVRPFPLASAPGVPRNVRVSLKAALRTSAHARAYDAAFMSCVDRALGAELVNSIVWEHRQDQCAAKNGAELVALLDQQADEARTFLTLIHPASRSAFTNWDRAQHALKGLRTSQLRQAGYLEPLLSAIIEQAATLTTFAKKHANKNPVTLLRTAAAQIKRDAQHYGSIGRP